MRHVGEIPIRLAYGRVTYLTEGGMRDLLKRTYPEARPETIEAAMAALAENHDQTPCVELRGGAEALASQKP